MNFIKRIGDDEAINLDDVTLIKKNDLTISFNLKSGQIKTWCFDYKYEEACNINFNKICEMFVKVIV